METTVTVSGIGVSNCPECLDAMGAHSIGWGDVVMVSAGDNRAGFIRCPVTGGFVGAPLSRMQFARGRLSGADAGRWNVADQSVYVEMCRAQRDVGGAS